MPANSSGQLIRHNVLRTFTDDEGEIHFDYLDPRIIELLTNIPVANTHIIIATDTLDYISYLYYRTTSAWWIIMRYNGIMNPVSLPVGGQLKIPSLEKVREIVNTRRKSTRGQVTI